MESGTYQVQIGGDTLVSGLTYRAAFQFACELGDDEEPVVCDANGKPVER